MIKRDKLKNSGLLRVRLGKEHECSFDDIEFKTDKIASLAGEDAEPQYVNWRGSVDLTAKDEMEVYK